MADFGCPAMMKRLTLVLVCASMELIEARVEWSAWFGVSTCSRPCSTTDGSMQYRRQCYNCTDEVYPCKRLLPEYCEGRSAKIDVCYVATSCRGEGLYVGEWTQWFGQYGCPSPSEPCTGAVVKLVRKCALPETFRDRPRPFRCPDQWATRKRLVCPCEVSHWLDWSPWSACAGPRRAGSRTRRRRCAVVSGVDCPGSSIEVGRCSVGCGDHQPHYRATRAADTLDFGVPSFVLPTVFVIIMMVWAWAYICWHTHKFVKTRKLKKDKDKDKDKNKGDEKDNKKDKNKDKNKDKK